MSYAKIRPRRGTKTEWNEINPVLMEGELGIEFPDSGVGSGKCKFKIGDGETRWGDLEYAFDGNSASAFDGGTVSISALDQILILANKFTLATDIAKYVELPKLRNIDFGEANCANTLDSKNASIAYYQSGYIGTNKESVIKIAIQKLSEESDKITTQLQGIQKELNELNNQLNEIY